MTAIDHTDLGLSRLITQYADKPKLRAMLTVLLQIADEIEIAGQAVLSSADIDLAVGSQLDLIGDIVGIDRTVPGALPAPFFGFTSTPNGRPYGDDEAGGGGEWYEEGEPTGTALALPDPTFRQFIRAAVVRNRSGGTAEDFIAVLKNVFPNDTILVDDAPGALRVQIGLDRETTATENAILSFAKILPKPAGVAIEVVAFPNLEMFFGFNPTDAPYGDDVTGGGGLFKEDTY